MKLLILNGPNLNLLGRREPALYGTRTYADLECFLHAHAARLGCEIDVRQSNHEGVLVDWVQEAYGKFDGIVINAAAYTHTSVALLDALLAVGLPAVEVHLTVPEEREPFRRVSYLRGACSAVFSGSGFDSYRLAMEYLCGTSPAQ